jgi:hypothetical protein
MICQPAFSFVILQEQLLPAWMFVSSVNILRGAMRFLLLCRQHLEHPTTEHLQINLPKPSNPFQILLLDQTCLESLVMLPLDQDQKILNDP